MKSTAVTCTTTPTLIVPADDINRTIYIQIENNKTVYIGDSTVTTSNGMPLEKHTAPHAIFLPLKETLYGVVTAQVATAVVHMMTPNVD